MKRHVVLTYVLLASLFLICCLTFAGCGQSKPTDAQLTLNFHSNFGAYDVEEATLLRSQVSSYAPFSREGYTFTGWSDRETGAIISDKTVLSNGMDLYAQWQLNVYTVRFVAVREGITVDLVPPLSVQHGSVAPQPSFFDFWREVQGYRFDGFGQEASQPVTSDVVFQAKLSYAECVARFYLLDELYFCFGGDEGDLIPFPPQVSLERDGFSYDGWVCDGAKYVEGETALHASSQTFNSAWTVNVPPSPIIFVNDEQSDSVNVNFNEQVTLDADAPDPPAGISYSYSWYEGALTEIPQDRSPVSGDHLFSFRGTQIREGGYDFTAVLTARDSDRTSTAHSFKTVHIDVLKLSSSVTAAATSNAYSAEWSGDPVTFSFVVGLSTQNYQGTTQFEYYVNGEKWGEGSTLPCEIEIDLTDGGEHLLEVFLLENEYYLSSRASLSFSIRSVSAYVVSRQSEQKYRSPSMYTLEQALSLDPAAQPDFEDGDSLYLIPNGNVYLSAGDYALHQNAVLFLPYSGTRLDAFFAHRADSIPLYYPHMAEASAPEHHLIMTADSHLNARGKILVGGVSGNKNSSSFQGATQGEYSQITLRQTSSLALKDGAILDVYGYILGDGDLIAESGSKLTSPLVVRDFRGGSNLLSTRQAGISAFNQYDLPNIRVPQTIKSGATVNAHMSLFAEGDNLDCDVTLISSAGSGASLLHLLSGELKVLNTARYDALANPSGNKQDLARQYVNATDIQLYGEAQTGYINFDASRYLIQFTTNTLPFAIPHGFSFTVKSGSSLTVINTFKLLPGSSLTVDGGATLSIGRSPESGNLAV